MTLSRTLSRPSGNHRSEVVKFKEKENSVGIVQTKFFELEGELALESGETIGQVTLAYEAYGRLDTDKSNAILVFHPLSGDAHAAGHHSGHDKKPGWWDVMIGPGKGIDTNKYFVLCINFIGGCRGSTGPCSVNPATKKPYGTTFPAISVGDIVAAQKRLVDNLGIKQLLAVVGGSIGGMAALKWAVEFPKSTKLVIPIATALKQSAQNIAFHATGRSAIVSDQNWNGGDYYGSAAPAAGLAVARRVSHITYLSESSLEEKFGRQLRREYNAHFSPSPEFEVESYLQYQGDAFVERFDANSYLYITKAIDYFDLTKGGARCLKDAFQRADAKFLVISFRSDWLYPTSESRKIVAALRNSGRDVSFFEIGSKCGHDSFLLENGVQAELIGAFLDANYGGENG